MKLIKVSFMDFSKQTVASLLIFSIIITGCGSSEPSEEEASQEEVIENTDAEETSSNGSLETITYGKILDGGGSREILATVETDSEVQIFSEIAGTLDEVNVSIGQNVSKGQVLARFKTTGDTTHVQYLNAVNSANATASSGEISIAQSQLSLDSARDALDETINSQEVSILQAETNVSNAQKSLDVTIKSQEATSQQALIALENAETVLEKTLATQSNVLAQAETTYENAKRSYDQTVNTGDQNYDQNFVTLKTQADSAIETYDEALEFLDRMLGITGQKQSLDIDGRSEVGSVNFKLKNSIKNRGQQLILDTEAYRSESVENTEEALTAYADLRVNLGKGVEDLLVDYIELTDFTIISSSFSQEMQANIRTQTESYRAKVNGSYTGLLSTLEGTKTSRVGNEGSLVGGENSLASAQAALAASKSQAEAAIANAQNAVDSASANLEYVDAQADAAITASVNALENAEAGLDFAKAQSEAAISSSQNSVKNAQGALNLSYAQTRVNNQNAQGSVNIAEVSQSKLEVISPISGKITRKQINQGVFTGVGTALFTVVNDSQIKKAVAFVSPEEWETLKSLDSIELEVNGETITSSQKALSFQVDPSTQKVQVEFLIEGSDVLVGSLVRVFLPLAGGSENLLPVSTVSFEPDGPEVLIIDKVGIITRKKVKTGNIVGNNLEILDGLNNGDIIVKNPSEVISGEKAE